MKLFTTFGSWGEIAPLLEIALRLQDEGDEVVFVTTADWAGQVREYGVECVSIPNAEKHADTMDAFLRAHVLGRSELLYDTIRRLNPSHLVASMYSLGALAYAAKNDVPTVITTCSPYYFMQTESAPAFEECTQEALALGGKPCFPVVGLYPWYLAADVGVPCVGFPELRPLKPLSDEVSKFIEQPYGVVTQGTLVDQTKLQNMVNAVQAHGLKCLYLGRQTCKADLSAFLDNHREAVKKAAVCITHAGIGTTIDCMHVPMVVAPVGYDQFYNAQRLIELRVAVGAPRGYIHAITEAQQLRSFLPNKFSYDAFKEFHDPQSHPRRHASDVGERAQVH